MKIEAFKMFLITDEPIWGIYKNTTYYKYVIQLGWWQIGIKK